MLVHLLGAALDLLRPQALIPVGFAFTGLWEVWDREGEVIGSCAIITTEANELMAEFHDRMPVILDPKDYDLWLDPEVHDPGLLEPLLRPYPSDVLVVYPSARW